MLVLSLPMQCQAAFADGTLFWGPSPGHCRAAQGQAHSRVEMLSEVGGLLACSFRATTVTVYSSPGFSPVWLKVVTVLGSWAITPPSLFCRGVEISIKKMNKKGVLGGLMHGEEVHPTLQPSTPSPGSPDCILALTYPTMEVQKPRVKSPTKRGAPPLLG